MDIYNIHLFFYVFPEVFGNPSRIWPGGQLARPENVPAWCRRLNSFSLIPLLLLTFFCLYAFLFASCNPVPDAKYTPRYAPTSKTSRPILIFGVHPLHNPQRLFEVYEPLVQYLNRNIPEVKIELEASRSYEEYENKLYSRHFDIALPNPLHITNSFKHGYHVFAKMYNDKDFRGIILVRKDSGIDKVSDLRGRAVCFPAASALAATLLPLYYLQTHGLDVSRDIKKIYSGSQESSIMNVYLKICAAGATWPPPWKAFVRRKPEIAGELAVRWESVWLVQNGLVARDDVPKEIVGKLASLFCSLDTHEEGRKILAALPVERFEPATDSTYQPVIDFMKTYNKTVH